MWYTDSAYDTLAVLIYLSGGLQCLVWLVRGGCVGGGGESGDQDLGELSESIATVGELHGSMATAGIRHCDCLQYVVGLLSGCIDFGLSTFSSFLAL